MRILLEFILPNEKSVFLTDHTFSGEGFSDYVNRIARAGGFFIAPEDGVAYRMSDLHAITKQV